MDPKDWFLSYKSVSNSEALRAIDNLTSNAGEIQERVLREILDKNGETEYLRRYMKGEACKDMMVMEFKRSVPVVKYKDICSYIKRIADGEHHSLLTGSPITELLASSGTSAGEPKLIPSIAEDLDRRAFFYSLIMPIINQHIPGLDKGKAMYLCFVKFETQTRCGLPIRTVLTSYYKSRHFKRRNHDDDAFNDLTSPHETILCEDTTQSMYCQLLSGLLHRNRVTRLGAIFASALLRVLTFLKCEWPQMCRDIRAGRLVDDGLITDTECRSAMQDLLTKNGPDPKLAAEIAEICGRTLWKGILTSLWPNAKYIEAVITGSMAQYVATLEFYSDGKIPLVCPMYASSETYFGVNLNPLADPEGVSFTLLPNMCYFEFIPVGRNGTLSFLDEDDDKQEVNDKVVDLVNVKLGCYYELVVTTFAGLNRYRIGDVLQVTGFHNKAPQFKFICRRNVVLSIDTDKTNEDDLHKSVSSAVKKLLEPQNAVLVEYTSYADTSSVPGHYVLFWEIQTHHQKSNSNAAAAQNGGHDVSPVPVNGLDVGPKTVNGVDIALQVVNELDVAPVSVGLEVMEDCCLAVEEGLDYIYRQCRAKDRSVGPLEIRVVKPKTFESLMDMVISNGGSINQYKTPRCINNNVAALKLLNACVTASFFSPRDPTWIG